MRFIPTCNERTAYASSGEFLGPGVRQPGRRFVAGEYGQKERREQGSRTPYLGRKRQEGCGISAARRLFL